MEQEAQNQNNVYYYDYNDNSAEYYPEMPYTGTENYSNTEYVSETDAQDKNMQQDNSQESVDNLNFQLETTPYLPG